MAAYFNSKVTYFEYLCLQDYWGKTSHLLLLLIMRI